MSSPNYASLYPTIISFYTKSWEYPEHANRFQKECNRLRLYHHIKEFPDSGEWIDNTRIKSTFIHETLKELKRPILWIDVDGSIHSIPTVLKLPIEYDFMGRHQRTGPKRNWHVGTLFFNYNDKTLELTKQWSINSIRGSDEGSFDKVWNQYAHELDITYDEFPENYFHIHPKEVRHDTVISHRLSRCPSKLKLKKRNAMKSTK